MRVRRFINRVAWLVVIGYAAIAAGSSYLQVRGLVGPRFPALGRPHLHA